jgi:hypothetical protein
LPDAETYTRLYHTWEVRRPYRRDVDAGELTYPQYRQRKFDRFMKESVRQLPNEVRQHWLGQVRQAQVDSLQAFQQQMSILSYLEPGTYSEVRRFVPF